MKTIDLYLLSIVQAFAHWYERKYHKDNYKQAYSFPIMIWVCSGWIAIAIQHHDMYIQNPDIPFGPIILSCISLCVLYGIVLTICATVFMRPLVTIGRRNTKEALLSNSFNPMIAKNYFSRIFLLISWNSICVLYLTSYNEAIDGKLIGVMTGLVLFVYFVSIEPIRSTKST